MKFDSEAENFKTWLQEPTPIVWLHLTLSVTSIKAPDTSGMDALFPKPGVPVMLGPNITGHVQSGYCAVVDGGNTPVGALYLDAPANIIARGNESSNQRRGLGIDASLSSTIFGGSETVQPTALKFLPCIKT